MLLVAPLGCYRFIGDAGVEYSSVKSSKIGRTDAASASPPGRSENSTCVGNFREYRQRRFNGCCADLRSPFTTRRNSALVAVLLFCRAGRLKPNLRAMTLNRLTATSLLRLRRRMLRSVLKIPLEQFERIDTARLLVAFTSDLAVLGAALRNFVHLFSGAAFLLACLAYLGWLSPQRGAVRLSVVTRGRGRRAASPTGKDARPRDADGLGSRRSGVPDGVGGYQADAP